MRTPSRPLRRLMLGTILFATAFASVLGAADAPPRKGGGGGRGGQGRGGPGVTPWWNEIDTGPFISDTVLTHMGGDVVALKGLAIKLGAARDVSVVFDTEMLAWRGGFEGALQLEGTAWSGSHGGNSHYPMGDARFFFLNRNEGRGFGLDGDWSDPREPKSGPLPHGVGRYRGLYRHGNDVVLHYTLGGVKVLEHPAPESAGGARVLTRTLNIDAAVSANLELLVRDPVPAAAAATPAGEAPAKGGRNGRGPAPSPATRVKPDAQVYLVGAPAGVTLATDASGRSTVRIAKGTPAARFKIAYAERALDAAALATLATPRDLAALTRGGPGLYPQTFAVKGQLDPAAATKTYAVDLVPLPAENPWKSPPRFGGFDFFPGGKRIAASTWNGDVWIADGIDGDLANVTWRRFASGLYQTLGLKIVDGVIYTQGRDQITRLHDLNGDGEADHFECFNNDVRITTGFHEFTFDLETDRAGNFYFSKAMPVLQGGRGFGEWTPHNGTVMKVSKDGAKLEVVAWGLRGPGGVGVSPDGVITTGENEGSWVPQCKITWTPPGKLTFNGVVPSKWDRATWLGPLPGAPTDYDRPLCWLPYYADNSSGSQAWVPENTAWDPRHAGEMLHLSYGKSSIFRVLREEVDGVVQGGAYRLPIDLAAAAMRARFHPVNGQLYVMGFRGWQTNGRDAFQRVRYTGVTTAVPVGLNAKANGVVIRFSAPLDPKTAEDPARYSVGKWNYVWGPQYGSGRFSIDQRDVAAEERAITVASKGSHNIIDTVTVGAARLLDDGRSVFLYLPKMTPAMQMELKLDLVDAKGGTVRETIYSTVHKCGPEFTLPGVRWEDIKIAETQPTGEPGLVLTFDSEVTDSVRVDQLAWMVPAGAAPSALMAPREFAASFHGMLVVPERDEIMFSLEGTGQASLQIDGKVIASGLLPLVAKAPATLAKGAHPIFCSYRSAPSGEGRVRLMWSSPQFRPEPVPASAFRHIPGAELASWTKVREGRELFAAAQCMKCHTTRGGVPRDVMPELTETLPDFANIGRRLDAAWLEKWVAQPAGHCPTVIEPNQVADVAAYLRSLQDAGAPAASVATDAAAAAAGAALVQKLNLGFWIEPLTRERKHTDGGLVEFLQQPAKHHADTTFPDVRLTRAEAAQIAAYVRPKQPAAGRVTNAGGNAAAGKAIAATACATCHDPAATAAVTTAGASSAPSLEEIARRDWSVKGCVAENRGRAPELRLSAEQRALLVTFRNADRDVGLQSLRRFSPAEYAARQMKALHCAECHGRSGDLKIPDIAQAGEKLNHAWLLDLIAGKHAAKTRPWLEPRMPAFASRASNLALGLAAKHGVPLQSESPAANAALAPIGAKLVGAEGYSCIACHDTGARKALAVFEGQGPNLQLAPDRLRYDYFQRWMHWPQRIAPATIMPRYTKDRDHAVLDTQLDGDAAKQFEAIWQYARGLKN